MPNIYDLADKHRRQVLALDREATARMVRAYAEAWQRISIRLDDLLAAIARHEAAGLRPIVPPVGRGVPARALGGYSASLLYERDRLQALLASVEREMAALGRFATLEVQVTYRDALAMAEDHAAEMLRTARQAWLPGLDVSFVQPNMLALQQQMDHLLSRGPLSRLLSGLPGAQGAALERALVDGIAQGLNPRQVARAVQRAHGGNLYRHTLITRTEMLRSYREGTHANYEANEDVLEGWVWHSGLDERTCVTCWARHGTLHPLTSRLRDHPHGRCVPIPYTKPMRALGVRGAGETRSRPPLGTAAFARLPAAEQRRILGPGKYEAYRKRRIRLDDLVEEVEHPDWGPSVRVASLGRALRAARARQAAA